MTDMVSEYKLECYQKVIPLGTNDNLWIVEDSVSKGRFVMRRLPIDMQQVYQRLAEIHHANIIEIIDIFSHNGFLYIIEEYLEWELLSNAMKTKKFSHRQVLNISKQLFNALLVLHEHNIIHRDIKPENIMIDAYGNVKLIDFDIARLFADDKSNDTKIKGSRNYAAPEQFGFAQSDQRTDIYSLGVTLNELAVGKLPEDKICTGILGIVIRHCIEFDPKKRYQSASQALKNIAWLEKKTVLIILSSVALLLFLISANVLIYSNKLHEGKYPASALRSMKSINDTDTYNFSEDESLLGSTAHQDRIISVRDDERYPSLLMADNQEYKFSTDLGRGSPVTISAEKTNEQLFLSCILEDGSTTDFVFDDVFSDIYKQIGYSTTIDLEETSPEYEILLDDLDEDGITDLLVTLAWRHRVDTPDPIYRYYLTEYSILWVVYTNEDNELTCSIPLFFDGYRPSLQSDTIIYDTLSSVWYSFQNGTWYRN